MTIYEFRNLLEDLKKYYKYEFKSDEMYKTYWNHLHCHECWEVEEAIETWKARNNNYFPSPQQLVELTQIAFMNQQKANYRVTFEDIEKAKLNKQFGVNIEFLKSSKNLFMAFVKGNIEKKYMLNGLENLLKQYNLPPEPIRKSKEMILEEYNWHLEDIYAVLKNKKNDRPGDLLQCFRELRQNGWYYVELDHKNKMPLFKTIMF